MDINQILELLPLLSTVMYCLFSLILVSGFRFSKLASWIIICFFLIFLIPFNAIIFYGSGKETMESWYILTVFLPISILLLFIGKRRKISLITGLFNAYLAFNLVFLIEATFKTVIKDNLIFEAVIYLLCFPLIMLYLAKIYNKLHTIVEELLPKYLILLLLYGVVMLVEIWFYRYIINYTDLNLLRLNIFSLAIFSVYFISIVGFYIFLRQYRKKNIELQEQHVLDEKMTGIIKQHQIREAKENELRILRHDMKHILINVSSLIKRNKNDEAMDFIKSYVNIIDNTSSYHFCKDPVIDTLLEFYKNKCDENKIKFKVKVNNFEDILKISTNELGVVISNCLDNAINANLKLKTHRFINFTFLNNDGRLILQIKNSYNGDIKYSSENIPTNNEENHGYGTKSINAFAKKYNLLVDYKTSKNTFEINILFQQ